MNGGAAPPQYVTGVGSSMLPAARGTAEEGSVIRSMLTVHRQLRAYRIAFLALVVLELVLVAPFGWAMPRVIVNPSDSVAADVYFFSIIGEILTGAALAIDWSLGVRKSVRALRARGIDDPGAAKIAAFVLTARLVVSRAREQGILDTERREIERRPNPRNRLLLTAVPFVALIGVGGVLALLVQTSPPWFSPGILESIIFGSLVLVFLIEIYLWLRWRKEDRMARAWTTQLGRGGA